MIKTVDQEVTRTQLRLNPIAYAIKSHIHSRPSQILAAALLSGSLAMPLTASAQNVLEEIIVTAQKREQNLQDVPISVTALSATKLEQLGIKSFEEYIAMMPSVSYWSVGPSSATIYMRGASDGGDGNASGSQPSVGLYFDEAPVTAIAANVDVHIYDIERIEALAGPQGTLYGGSNQSGTLRIISNKPDTEKFSGGFDVGGFGTEDGEGSYSIEGFANIPLNDKAAIRLVAWNIEEGGWIDNVAAPDRTYVLPTGTATLSNAKFVGEDQNDLTKRGLRAALKVDLSENWVANVSVLYQSLDTEGTWDHDPGPVNSRSDTVSAPFDAGGGPRNIGLHTPAGERKIQRFHPDSSDEDFIMGSWTLEGEVANHNLLYAGAYYDRDVQYQADYSAYGVYQYFVPYYACDYYHDPVYSGHAHAAPVDMCTSLTEFYTEDNNYQRQTHEVRLSSLAEGRLHYTLGGYFTEITHKYLQQWHQPGMSDALEVGGEDGIYFRTDQERTNQETAVFGDLTYDLTDAFSVSGGFRYFWNDSELAGVVGWGPGNFAVRDTPVDLTLSDQDYILKGNATWRLTDDHMVYFTYSEGFRPGGINRDPGLLVTAGTQIWTPDTITNYEFGWKTTWLDGRLRINGATFFAKWDNIQYTVYEFGLSACCGNVYNLTTAEMKGFEVDTTLMIKDGWTISAAMAYVDAKTTDDFVLPSGNLSVASGTALPNIPKFKGNVSTRYEFNMANYNAYTQLTAQYTGSMFNEIVVGNPTDLSFWNERQKQGSYHNLNFRAGIDQGDWGVDVFINNLTDEVAELYIQPRPYEASTITNRPRSFGAKYWMRF